MIVYEWDIEERSNYEEDGKQCFDIENHNFSDTLEGFGSVNIGDIDNLNYVLVLHRRDCDSYGDWTGEEAELTLKDGQFIMPEYFLDIDGDESHKIPQIFRKELQSFNKNRKDWFDKPVRCDRIE